MHQVRSRVQCLGGDVCETSSAGGSGHSAFADTFLEMLDENNAFLGAESLFWTVRIRVVSASQKLTAEQLPTYDSITWLTMKA